MRLLLLAVLLAACSLPGSQVSDGPGLAGVYVVNGVDPLGVEYSGTVTISESGVGTYAIEWVVTGAILEGTGAIDGDRLEVEWRAVGNPRGASSGSASYTVESDGSLVGTRSVDGVDGVGTEEIFPRG